MSELETSANEYLPHSIFRDETKLTKLLWPVGLLIGFTLGLSAFIMFGIAGKPAYGAMWFVVIGVIAFPGLWIMLTPVLRSGLLKEPNSQKRLLPLFKFVEYLGNKF